MLSILSAVKNREEHLLESLPTWLDVADEIVVVDWGSDKPLSENKYLLHEEKVKIVQVNKNHAKHWTFSQAYNTAARFTPADLYIIMNADESVVDASSITSLRNPTASGFCYEGTTWGAEEAHGVYFLYIDARAFWKVNGYHEDLIGYGYDDVDLRNRLRESGLEVKTCEVKIAHKKHDHEGMTRENVLNQSIASHYPWSVNERLVKFYAKMDEEKNIIYLDIDMIDRITDEEILNREARGAALKQFGMFVKDEDNLRL